MSAPTRQEMEAQIAQFLEPWAWETTSYNATVARDDALAKAAQIVEVFPALASQAAQSAEADGVVIRTAKRLAARMGAEFVPHATTPKAPATNAGEVAVPGWLTDDERARVAAHEGRATPPAPNDDLRAALEAAIDRMGWPEIHAFQDELRKGQDVREDAGGFMLRAIKALFGITPTDPVTTYQQAARALVDAALKENRRG